MLAKVVLIGRIVRDPEVRTTTTGKSVASFSVAVNRRFNTEGGTDADFFRVKAWGQTADYLEKYATKGRLISVDGRLETQKWTDQSGANRETVEIVAENVSLLDKDPNQQGGGGNSGGGGGRASAPAPAADEYDPFADE